MNIFLTLAVLVISLAVLLLALDAPAAPQGRAGSAGPVDLVRGRDFYESPTKAGGSGDRCPGRTTGF